MNEENIKQVEFRLKKLKETVKKIADGTDKSTAKKWIELSERASTIRALLYEDFEALGADVIYFSQHTQEDYRHKLVNLMLSIFKECRR